MGSGFLYRFPEHAAHGFQPMATTDSDTLGKLDAMPSERVVGMTRNRWLPSIGIDGRYGPDYAGGHYLTQKHTQELMKERWVPNLVDRRTYRDWEKDGRRGAREWANEKAKWILANHRPEPLETKLREELSKIIAALEK